jgi:hypothetical protein
MFPIFFLEVQQNLDIFPLSIPVFDIANGVCRT